MNTKVVPVDRPGLYLFRDETQLSVTVYNELAVFLFEKSERLCALALLSPDRKLTEISAMLSSLFEKLKSGRVEAKIFGLSSGQPLFYREVKRWLAEKNIPLRASDVGRDLSRVLTVDCATGKIGVRYARSTNESELLLHEESARSRDPLDRIHTEVLILSCNSVKRRLAQQAVEEYPNFVALTSQNPKALLNQSKISQCPAPVVLLLEDLEEEPGVANWIKRVSESYPFVQLRWVGVKLPSFARDFPSLRLLPPVEPLLLPEFKAKLRRAVFEYLATGTAGVVPFRRKKTG